MVLARSSPRSESNVITITCLFVLSMFFVQSAAIPAIAIAATPQEDLATAQVEVLDGNFEEALQILSGLLSRSDADATTRRSGLILSGQCHVTLGDRAQAVQAFCEANRIGPELIANTSLYNQDEIAIMGQVVEDPACSSAILGSKSKPLIKKPAFWVAGGLAVVAAAAVFLLSSSSDETPDLQFPDAP